MPRRLPTMNRFTASLFALGLGIGAVFMAGCGAAPLPDDADGDNAKLVAVPPPPDPPAGCDRYEAYSSALAEFTVDCTGSIGPDSFLVDPRGFLRRNFQSCIPRLSTRNDQRNPLKDVDALLSLQLPGPEKFLRSNDDGSPVLIDKGVLLPPFHVCLAAAWKVGLWKYASDGRPPCPTWTKVGVDPQSDEPNAEGIAQFSKGLPVLDGSTQLRPAPLPKENFYYAVAFTPAQERLAQSVSP